MVDDGIATGSTARVACQVARALGAARVIVAAPVASLSAVRLLGKDADEVVVLDATGRFRSVGESYDDFAQVTDAEVMDLLARAAEPAVVEEAPAPVEAGDPPI